MTSKNQTPPCLGIPRGPRPISVSCHEVRVVATFPNAVAM